MSVEIDGVQISSWNPVIIRGGVFQVPIAFFDEAGDPEATLSASIEITPNGAAAISWTQANGLFPQTSVGEYVTDLNAAYTTALTWDSGRYRLAIVDSSGFPAPCIIEGLIFVKSC